MSEPDETMDDGTQDSPNFAKLRQRADAAEARATALATKVKAQAVQIAGFKADDPVVQLVIEKWSPENDDAITGDAFATFAAGYNLKPAPAAAAPEGADAAAQQAAGQAAAIDQQQNVGDTLRNTSTPGTPTPSIEQQVADAQAKGDWTLAGRLKDKALLESTGLKI